MSDHRTRRLRRAVLTAAALTALAAPAQALAGKAEVTGGELKFTAAAGEKNDVVIQRTEAGELSFYDGGNTKPTAGTGCRKQSGDAVCSAEGVTKITVSLGNRDDSLSVEARTPAITYSGGAGTDRIGYGGDDNGAASITIDDVANDGRDGLDNIGPDVEFLDGTFVADRLIAGQGRVLLDGSDGDDELTGGPRNDTIDAASVSESGFDLGEFFDEGTDTIACGGGNDQVFADRRDQIAADCEVVGLPPKSGDRYPYTGSAAADRIDVREFVYAVVKAGAGNDVIRLPGHGNGTLYGGKGNDDIRGDRGLDRFIGGAGRDTINARDRTRDKISCGSGRDRVTADKVDVVKPDCEKVTRRR
jgi:Ca2+-binding RTX toxin-like protein